MSDLVGDERLLIHIGYHKTGSTWLQDAFFPMPGSGFVLPWVRAEVNEEFVLPNDFQFDRERTVAFFREGLARAGGSGLVPVLSNERLSGNPHSGGFDSKQLADRLVSLFPGARVLAVVREQQSAIRSAYYQYVREGGVASIEGYLHPPEAGRYRLPLFDFDYFAYDRLIAYYQKLFGADRVLVLAYEDLAVDPRAFAAEICRFVGLGEPDEVQTGRRNVGLSGLSVAIKRRFNALFVRDALNVAPPLPWDGANRRLWQLCRVIDRVVPRAWTRAFDVRVRRRIAEAVEGRYAKSNRRVQSLTGLDLGRHGYDVGESPAASSEASA
jgi:hypothetical protein